MTSLYRRVAEEAVRESAWNDAEQWHYDPRARKLMAEIDVAEQLSDWALGVQWIELSHTLADQAIELTHRLEELREEILDEAVSRFLGEYDDPGAADGLLESAICFQDALDRFRKERLVTVSIDIAPDTGCPRVAA